MKKATAIFFIFFLCISQVGHLLMYYVQLWQVKSLVKQEIMAGVQERLCSIIEDNENIRWEEAGKEFSLNGALYDVVMIKKNKGKTFLYSLNDNNEEQLVKNFARIIASSSNHEKGKSSQPFKFHITDQYIACNAQALLPVHAPSMYHVALKPALASRSGTIPLPPPWS